MSTPPQGQPLAPIIPTPEPRGSDAVVHLIAARLDALHGDMQEVKGVQKEMAAAFSKLILIEERQANTAAAQERSFKALEKLEVKLEAYTTANREACKEMERRLDSLEAQAPTNKRVTDWVFMGVIGFVALVAPKLIERFL